MNISEQLKDIDFKDLIKKQQIRSYVEQYKKEKKEPIEMRRDYLLEVIHNVIIADIHDIVTNRCKNSEIEEIDKEIEKSFESYEDVLRDVNRYYDAKLKEIDDMRVKVVMKSEES